MSLATNLQLNNQFAFSFSLDSVCIRLMDTSARNAFVSIES